MAITKKQEKDLEQRKIFGKVFDNLAVKDLFRLKSKGVFDTYKGIYREGKESRILIVEKGEEKRIVKIYKIEAGNFKHMIKYLEGDERFKNIRHNRRSIIYAWCKKEYHNLLIAKKLDLNTPKPYEYIHNIIAMEMIGDQTPYPQLKEVRLENPEKVLNTIIKELKILVQQGSLVHGDISEFNILIGKNEKPYIIDFAQAVTIKHPFSKEMLERDVENLINYFNKIYSIGASKEEIFNKIAKGIWDA